MVVLRRMRPVLPKFFLVLIHIIMVSLSISAAQHAANSSSVDNSAFFSMSSNGTLLVTVELDIMMTLEQYKELHSPGTRKRRRASRDISPLWEQGVVMYKLARDVEIRRPVIQAAMDLWRKYTCLTFMETVGAEYLLVFKTGRSCTAHVGKRWNVQDVIINRGCSDLRSIMHFIGHSIGLYHEHTRPDRDKYIHIDYDKLPPAYHSQFDKRTEDINIYSITYDYMSIMHYVKPGVITTLDPAYQDKIGTGNGVSFKDIKRVNLMYQCISSAGCPRRKCPFNGFVFFKAFKNTRKCECWCDSGNLDDPLVLCSSIRKEVPEPNIKAASMLESSDDSDCVDMRDNCTDLKERGVCRKEIVMMNNMCAKTCDFCGKAKHHCMDHDDGCDLIASTGACQRSGLREMMSSLCPMSCGLCVTVSAPCQIERSLIEPPQPSVSGVSNRKAFITFTCLLVVASSCWL